MMFLVHLRKNTEMNLCLHRTKRFMSDSDESFSKPILSLPYQVCCAAVKNEAPPGLTFLQHTIDRYMNVFLPASFHRARHQPKQQREQGLSKVRWTHARGPWGHSDCHCLSFPFQVPSDFSNQVSTLSTCMKQPNSWRISPTA